MCYLSTDRTGTRLFAASYGGAKLGVSRIEAGIAGDTLQVIETPPKAHSIVSAPDGSFVYAACLGGEVILAQRFDGAALDPVPNPAARTKPGAGPRHLAFAGGGRRLYCVNEVDATVNAYDRDPVTGALTERQSISALPHPVPGSAAAADIHLTPDERFLYASVRSTNTLACYRVDAGRLTLLEHAPAEPAPRGFAIEPHGEFLLCAGMHSGTVATHQIDPQSGRLTRIGAVPTGAEPNWVEVLEEP
jgi:6-phosphogluconolactonase